MKEQEARAFIRSEFPHIPAQDLTKLVPRVIQAQAFSFGEFAAAALRSIVEAHIRHTKTNYDSMLRLANGHYYDGNRSAARYATSDRVSSIFNSWR